MIGEGSYSATGPDRADDAGCGRFALRGRGWGGSAGRGAGFDTSNAFRPPASQADALRGAPRALGPGRGWRRRLQCGLRQVKGVPPACFAGWWRV